MTPKFPQNLVQEIRSEVLALLAVREPRLHRSRIKEVGKLASELLKLIDLVESERNGFRYEAYDTNDVLDTLHSIADLREEHGGLEVDVIVEAVDDLSRLCAMADQSEGKAGRPTIKSWKYLAIGRLADYWGANAGMPAKAHFISNDKNETIPANDSSIWISQVMNSLGLEKLGLEKITNSELKTILKHRRNR